MMPVERRRGAGMPDEVSQADPLHSGQALRAGMGRTDGVGKQVGHRFGHQHARHPITGRFASQPLSASVGESEATPGDSAAEKGGISQLVARCTCDCEAPFEPGPRTTPGLLPEATAPQTDPEP